MEVQKKVAELAYLRSQIDPHFLHNTLEAVRRMAQDKNVPEIADMAADMGKIFKYSAKGASMVTLKDEMEIIKAYLNIQQRRFGDRISIHFFLSDEAKYVMVPKMITQPAVENAMLHGLEPMSRKGALYIGARLDGVKLIITVKDNGVGIPADKLNAIRDSLKTEKADTSRHMGLLNMQSRIRLQYGAPYGLEIDSSENDGTTVTMTFGTKMEGKAND